MQMFPDVSSFGSETRPRAEMGESRKHKHAISERGPAPAPASSLGTFTGGFRSLTVIPDRNDKRKLSENVPVSNFQLNAVLSRLCSDWPLQPGWKAQTRLGGRRMSAYDPDRDREDQDDPNKVYLCVYFLSTQKQSWFGENQPALDCPLLVGFSLLDRTEIKPT